MKLSLDQVKQYIKKPYSQEVIDEGIKIAEKGNLYVNGIGLVEHLAQIENFENAEQLSLRQKTAISSKHIFHSIVRVINKIFSAKGGSDFYDIPEDKGKELREKLKDIKGIPLRKWLENKGLNKYLVDPNGVFLIEHTMSNGSPLCYPTYKSINVIHDYQHTGRELDYLILKQQKKEDDEAVYYRVYDDESDTLYRFKDDILEVVDSFINPWGKVPAIIIGDYFHNEIDMYDSRFSVSYELSDKRVRTESVKNVYEFKHGYPLTWQLLTRKCTVCDGTGYIEGKVCTACSGSGYDLKKDVSKVIGIIPPKTTDEARIVPDVAGYVQPDLDTWREFRVELEWLEKLMQFTLLGSYTREKADRETATSRFIDVQPVNDTLNSYADWVESTEQYISNFMGKFYFPVDYKSCSINLGRRYMIESPDEVWAKYQEARKIGAPTEKLDDDMIEYYETKYVNDVTTLEIQKKLFWCNDYRHVTIEESAYSLPASEYIRRVYFDRWVTTLNDADILNKSIDDLKKEYDVYVEPFIKEYKESQVNEDMSTSQGLNTKYQRRQGSLSQTGFDTKNK